jgi:hypothetical protein
MKPLANGLHIGAVQLNSWMNFVAVPETADKTKFPVLVTVITMHSPFTFDIINAETRMFGTSDVVTPSVYHNVLPICHDCASSAIKYNLFPQTLMASISVPEARCYKFATSTVPLGVPSVATS